MAFLIIIALVFSQAGLAYARGFSGGGRSFGGSSFSRSSGSFSSYRSSSSGWSGSSSSSKSYGSWGGSSSGSSSSRNVPGSYSTSGTSSFNSYGSKTGTAKNSYMQNTYNNQASASNFKTYKQNLNAEQQKVYDSSMNRNYNVGSRLNYNDALNTRNQRISNYDTNPVRVHVNNYYFGGPLSYGSAFVGIWDMWFLMRASNLFWYHHWNDINPYSSYFNTTDFAARQAAVNAMQAQGIAKNTSYLDPNVNPDLQFSKSYVDSHANNIYNTSYRRPSSHPFLTLIFILVFAAILIWFIKKLLKKPVKTRYSSIY